MIETSVVTPALLAEIEKRIAGYQQKLEAIDLLFTEELSKPIAKRSRLIIMFLYKERSLYNFASCEMRWLYDRLANCAQ